MARILISGLVNMETTARVRQFPIPYYPIDYTFFGVDTDVSGVAYNIAKAMTTLGDEVRLLSLTGRDLQAEFLRRRLSDDRIGTDDLLPTLRQTAASVVLYDETGKRQIYCDLKDVQEQTYPFSDAMCTEADVVVACNTNFNRPLLHMAKRLGKTVATDVHVLSDAEDDYNREFLECADIVFLSDEAIGETYEPFLRALAQRYPMKILVLGRGSRGAAMYLRETGQITAYPAVSVGQVVNTVGAGDALFSAFVHYYAQGHDPREALLRAQIFASVKIGTSGASHGFATAERVECLRAQFEK